MIANGSKIRHLTRKTWQTCSPFEDGLQEHKPGESTTECIYEKRLPNLVKNSGIHFPLEVIKSISLRAFFSKHGCIENVFRIKVPF